tara:strand:- start:4638 stop:5393 length:756 start_codon:yes stop_codon:yes gene_type:complete
MASDLSAQAWNELSREQTPENLKVDKDGRRAWGYKRFKLSHLMAFANKNKCTVTVHSPYVYMERKKEAELPTTLDSAKCVAHDLIEDNMDEEVDDEWKIAAFDKKPDKPAISSSVVNSLRRTCGDKVGFHTHSCISSHLHTPNTNYDNHPEYHQNIFREPNRPSRSYPSCPTYRSNTLHSGEGILTFISSKFISSHPFIFQKHSPTRKQMHDGPPVQDHVYAHITQRSGEHTHVWLCEGCNHRIYGKAYRT